MNLTLSRKDYHSSIYFFGLALIVVGMPLSNFLMSLSQFVLLGNWLIEGDIKSKLKSFRQNKTAVIVCSFFLLPLLGLFYSSDFSFALKDIRTKAPLLILPLIFSSSPPLSRKQFEGLLFLFVAAVFGGTMVSMAVLLGFTGREIIDIRQISVFISHIRFSLLICLSIFILAYYIWKPIPNFRKFSFILLIFWLLVFLIILESLTGILILITTSFALLVYTVFMQKKIIYKFLSISLILFFVAVLFNYLNRELKDYYQRKPVNNEKLEELTASGNKYFHDVKNKMLENGNYVWQYICWEELEQQWNKRSTINFMDKDIKGNQIKYTLIRYLTSKNLRKDAGGIQDLTADDIRNIEHGSSNVKYSNIRTFEGRVHSTIWELDNYYYGGNPSGHSVTQRIEFWKAALGIVKENPWIGVGTGDAAITFEEQYEKMNSPLSKEWRLRSHNQFLAVAVSFGIIGLVWFLLTLFYPIIVDKKAINYFYIIFLVIAVLSMLTEDTLETQAGVTFFAFFNAFFLFLIPDEVG